MNQTQIRAAVLMVVTVAIILFARITFSNQHVMEPIVPGPGVTKVAKLSEYFDGLKGTPGDTDVYVLEGGRPGGSMLVLGGTHPTEPAGVLTAVLLVENVDLSAGTLFVIPHANISGFTWTESGYGHPDRFYIETEWGERWFSFGARGTNLIHQWPDPEMYVHYPSGQILAPSEIRNLNRSHPGKPDGNLTQKVAYGIAELIRNEKVDITVDLHEAPPEKPLINAICAHERAMELATWAALYLEMEHDMNIRLEASPPALRGLSHRELGDHTDTLAVLLETANPLQGTIRGRTDASMAVTGQDALYEKAGEMGRLFVDFDENGHPLEQRVARDITTIFELGNAFTDMNPDKPLVMRNVPGYETLMQQGVGHFLRPVN